jgi:hypothetical protein
MIIKCKVCKGTGRGSDTVFSTSPQICPACKGAGEFKINVSQEKLVNCKYCKGEGRVAPHPLSFGLINICPACKGIGLIKRPILGSEKNEAIGKSTPLTLRLSYYDYDIAVSFAGEDREIVEQYIETISPRAKELKIFYDKWEQSNLWGTNLYDKLDEVYRTKALCCVIFISQHYANKIWTNHERKAIQARALQENREYILPIRLDDTELPGMLPTTSYLDVRETPITQIALITIKKVNKLKSKNI